MRKYFFIPLVFIVAISKPLFLSANDSIVHQVFVLIYNEKYTEAHTKIETNKTMLGSFYSDVLKIDLLWWEFVQSQQNHTEQKEFILFLEKFDHTSQNSSELKLRQLIKNSYQIRYEFKRFNIIGAMSTRTTLKNLLDEIMAEELPFPESHLKLLGVYSALFQYFDNLVNPFFNKGRRENRASALVRVERYTHDDDIIVKTLSLYFLGRIYLNIEKEKEKGIRCFAELSNYYTHNALFKEVVAKHN